jgi:transcriptional regulator with PAS, ATPase and Fis domain
VASKSEKGAQIFHGMWTKDEAMRTMFRLVERASKVEAPVLVRGDTGAGKELVARAIHDLSPRASGPFRAINCAVLPANLLESELFGHVRGAFTGAVKDAPGHMQLAHKGTLFLDEVAEIPTSLQAKLLRALETRTVLPVGARNAVSIDVRFVSATNQGLRRAVEEGRFRADLMFRLRVIPIFLPPLCERREDIMLLTEKFMAEHNARGGRLVTTVARPTQRILEAYTWPGNVRELRNVLEYAYAIGDGSVLVPADLPPELTEKLVSTSHADPEYRRIQRALEKNRGNRSRAAELLGMSRITLWRRMRDLGLQNK